MTTGIALIGAGWLAGRCLVWRAAMVCLAGAISIQRLSAQNARPGSVDSSFAGRVDGSVEAIRVQPDGRLLVGGRLGGGNLVRLNRDGAADPTFTATSGVPWQVTKMALQPDGKV